MDLRRYAHLVALADEGSFGRAALRVHLSQPALSRSIQAAEQELGLILFERGGSRIRCTPAGTFVVDRARQLLQESNRLERDLALYRNLEIGELAFGIGTFAAPAYLPGLIASLRTRHPGVALRIKVNNSRVLASLVQSGQAEFFAGDVRYVTSDPAFHIERLGRLGGGFYVRRGHPLSRQRRVRLADFAPFGFATSWLPGEVEQLLAQAMGLAAGAPLPLAVECDDAQALKTAMLSGDAVMVGSAAQVAAELASGSARRIDPVDAPEAYSELGIVRLSGRSFSPIAQEAVDLLVALARDGEKSAAPG